MTLFFRVGLLAGAGIIMAIRGSVPGFYKSLELSSRRKKPTLAFSSSYMATGHLLFRVGVAAGELAIGVFSFMLRLQ